MKELVLRINFFSATFLSITGLSLIGEIFQEDDPADKLDDIAMAVLAVIVIFWYKKTGWKAATTSKSLVFIAIGIVIKIIAIIIEHADKEAAGDDFGILSALILAFIFVFVQTITSKKESV